MRQWQETQTQSGETLRETRLSSGATSPLANERTWCDYDSCCITNQNRDLDR